MSIVPFKENVTDGLDRRYGVGAFNFVNNQTLEAVSQAVGPARSPVVVKTSKETFKSIGIEGP